MPFCTCRDRLHEHFEQVFVDRVEGLGEEIYGALGAPYPKKRKLRGRAIGRSPVPACLWNRGQQESVRLTLERAGAGDLPCIVNSICFLQDPAASSWDHLVQVPHFRPIRGNKGAVDIAAVG